MTNDTPQEEQEADRRFNETLKRLVSTPHKPHKEKREPGKPDARRLGEG